jgi:hypothetical protein
VPPYQLDVILAVQHAFVENSCVQSTPAGVALLANAAEVTIDEPAGVCLAGLSIAGYLEHDFVTDLEVRTRLKQAPSDATRGQVFAGSAATARGAAAAAAGPAA